MKNRDKKGERGPLHRWAPARSILPASGVLASSGRPKRGKATHLYYQSLHGVKTTGRPAFSAPADILIIYDPAGIAVSLFEKSQNNS